MALSDFTRELAIRIKYEEIGRKQLDSAFKNLEHIQEKQSLMQQKLRVAAEKLALKNQVLAKRNQFVAHWADKLGINTNRVGKIMAEQGLVFDKFGNTVDLAGRRVINLNKAMNEGKDRKSVV